MIQVLTVIAPLFLIIFASALVQKYKKIGENWSDILNEFALKVGLPALIFSSLAQTAFTFTGELLLIAANSIFLLLSFALALLIGKLLRLNKQMFLTLFICFAFGNVAYLGIPVLTRISGEAILPQASLIVAVYLFWLFTIGIGYLDYSTNTNKHLLLKNSIKNLLSNPLLLAVILGLVVGGFSIQLPTIVLSSLNMIAASVTPIVLIVIGLFIGKSRIGKLSEWFPVLLFSVCTLVVLPAIFYFGLHLFGLSPDKLSHSIIEAAMPLAITPFALANKYNLNKNFIARSIVLSTIVSAISLPVWISIVS